MAITQEQFDQLDPSQVLVDSYGREWEVLSNETHERWGHVVIARCPGYGSEELVFDDGKVMERDEWAIIVELNCEEAYIAQTA